MKTELEIERQRAVTAEGQHQEVYAQLEGLKEEIENLNCALEYRDSVIDAMKCNLKTERDRVRVAAKLMRELISQPVMQQVREFLADMD